MYVIREIYLLSTFCARTYVFVRGHVLDSSNSSTATTKGKYL